MLLRAALEKKIVVCCGTGGVGKTTTSAALALRAAAEGKKVALVTIDPAKRLATSLGLTHLGADPQDLGEQAKKALGKPLRGSLSALMLDSENTFYRFLLETGGKETHDAFKASNLFEIIASNLGGAHDYFAMEKLHELDRSGKFDLVVLDTPPARHTLDFLEAPERIARFFDDRIFSWFLTDARSSRFTEKIRATGAKAALSVLEKITGEGVLNDFVKLAPHIYKVKNSFVERQSYIKGILQSKHAGSVFVSSPGDLARGESKPFLEDSRAKGIAVIAVIVNRSLRHLAPHKNPASLRDAPEEAQEIYRKIRFLVEEEEKNFKLLQETAKQKALISVPEMETDVHDFAALFKVAEYL